jgi:hypothetical protein
VLTAAQEQAVLFTRRNHPEVVPHLLTRLMAYVRARAEMAYYQDKLLVVEADRKRLRE